MDPTATDAAAPPKLPTYAELAAQLAPRHRRFLEEYPVDWNASAALRRAGFKGTDKGARFAASKLLDRPDVLAALDARLRELADAAQLRTEAILLEVKRIAYSDARRVASWGPRGVRIHDSKTLSADDAAAVSEIVATSGRYGPSRRVKMHDKLAALELLGRYRKMWTDKWEHSGEIGGGVLAVPGAVTPETWSVAARQQQTQLVESHAPASTAANNGHRNGSER